MWGGTKPGLVDAGYDVVWSGDWAEDPGDETILATARRENRILVTLDKDFGEMAIVKGIPHCGIVRLVGIAARNQFLICKSILTRYGDELLEGAIVTVTDKRVRIRTNS